MSKHEEAVKAKIDARCAAELVKYGVSMERDDLSQIEWLEHLQAEYLDGAIYAERAIHDLKAKMAGQAEVPAEDRIPWAEYPWAQYSCLDRHDQRMMTEFEIRLDGINWVWADKDGRAEFIDIPRPKPDIAGSLRKRPEGV